MSQTDFFSTPIDRPALAKRMLGGVLVALVLILLFLVPIQNPDPEWGQFWIVRPLLVVSLAGAAGGACFYFITRNQTGRKKMLAIGFSFLVYVIGLWMGTILGLAGTLWD